MTRAKTRRGMLGAGALRRGRSQAKGAILQPAPAQRRLVDGLHDVLVETGSLRALLVSATRSR